MSSVPEPVAVGVEAIEVAAHASKLVGRLQEAAPATHRAPSVIEAAAHYLAQSILDARTDFRAHAAAAAVELGEFSRAVGTLRRGARFRAYLWDWIGRGRPRLTKLPRPVAPDLVVAPDAELAVAAEKAESEEDVHSFVERVRRKSSNAVSRLRTFYNSWTGSRGTTSYYDKDSSPD